jgi:hypothetical protein
MVAPQSSSRINVLFEGGETIRRCLLKECEVHALLRLPTGCQNIFAVGGSAPCSGGDDINGYGD